MTRLPDTLRARLEDRREQFLIENREALNRGDWTRYARNCLRISKISAELARREYQKGREAYIQWLST